MRRKRDQDEERTRKRIGTRRKRDHDEEKEG